MPKYHDNDIDSDPMFDVSPEARSNALDRQLIQYLERVETLAAEKKDLADDTRDVYAEAKAQGYDTKIMRQIIKLRAMSKDARSEMDLLMETYRVNAGID